jgi:hypothetical protein
MQSGINRPRCHAGAVQRTISKKFALDSVAAKQQNCDAIKTTLAIKYIAVNQLFAMSTALFTVDLQL